MPSPFAHAVAGLTVHVLAARSQGELKNGGRAALLVAAAVAPDLDLLFQFVDGRNHHNNETHSVGAVLLAGFAAAVLSPFLGLKHPRALALAVSLSWSTHLVLDYLNRDTNPPIGILALWPFSGAYFKFPWPLFLDIGRTLEWVTVRHNLLAASWEAVLLLPLLFAAIKFRSRRLERASS